MAFRPLVTIGDYEVPAPSTYEGNTSTIVDSARNVKGVMVGAVIRDDVGKVTMTWNFLPTDKWAAINKVFKISAGGKFINSVTFFDQSMGDWTTRNMYVSDRSAGLYLRKKGTGDVIGWKDCKLSLIEV